MISAASHLPQLEKYEVLEEIGHGGMATVYRARDRRLERDVAVKVIHRHLRENGEVAARFTSEARAVAKLKHPNIVEVYDVSDDGDPERYLIVELVDGTTLRKLLQDRKHLPAEIAAVVALEVGSALQHAHEQGVVHRDVKPENVLVSLRGPTSSRDTDRQKDAVHARIKITDFGIAKLLDAQGVTSTGQVLGSPAHMAPEQIEGGEVTDRADVFGLGVLLYECMVGRLPFEGKNPAQVLRRVLDGTFTVPERARPGVGQRFSRIIERALSREAEARYPSVAELCDALKAELERVGFGEPRRELSDYLNDPVGYERDFVDRIVPKLVELGRAARSRRDIPEASAEFNRALALRPGDQELVEQVAGMERRERAKRVLGRVGAIAAGSAALGLLAYGVTRQARSSRVAAPEVTSEPLTVRSSLPVLVPPKLTATPRPEPPASAAPKSAPVGRFVAAPPASAAPVTQLVQVVIQGAKGKLLIDGVERPWMGQQHELTLGKHTFEVVPPTAECCVPKPPVEREIRAKDGVLYISLSLPFKDASITLVGDPGAQATCRLLFPDTLEVGQTRRVAIPGPDPVAKGTCTITGPEGTPKSVQVELSPGAVRTLTWP